MIASTLHHDFSQSLTDVATRLRLHLLEMHHKSGAAHLGSAMSCVDILVAIYWGVLRSDPQRANDPHRDRFILSKGHAASALYAALACRGYFDETELEAFGCSGSRLAEQPGPGLVPGVEAATGSLGHGLPIGCGLAKAARILDDDSRVYVLLSDGECNEGSVWEAAMFAAAQRLGNLTVIVDYNHWQATGRSDEVLAIAPLAEKWKAFGFATVEVDGHDIAALQTELRASEAHLNVPSAIIANTTKGKGVSFMEDDNNWHYRSPNVTELAAARRELIGG